MLNSTSGPSIALSYRWAAWLTCVLGMLCLPPCTSQAQNQPVHVIAFGAHPDDCDLGAGGLAAEYAAHGDKVKFVSLTNGDAGHQTQHGDELANRRRAEAQEAARRIGIEYDVLDNHDGKLFPTLGVREQVIREIRSWKADVVIAPRPNDYHPDHRNTGILVQDASYMVTVPDIVPEVPALHKNPVFLYFSDHFQRPQPFQPDIVVSIDDVYQRKLDMLDAHVSQFYEWLPWHDGQLDNVPNDPAARKQWIMAFEPSAVRKVPEAWRPALEKRYGPAASKIRYAEAFEITEYGSQPSEQEIRRLFPFFPVAARDH
jgi:LmbE family N-acetylglucosaminyl deacetylase